MSQSLNDGRDRLAAHAARYEETLLPDGTVDEKFESRHAGLARTVRMLNAVFRPGAVSTPQELAEQPAHIGRFQVRQSLGSGSFGSVWLAHDPVLKRDVAVKVAHVGTHARADLQERFQREAHLAARLHHPNIVQVHETDVDDGRLFIVSEYCEGQSLAEWLVDHEGHVPPVLAARLIRQLADAADHAHRHGLIHRDIKPANVLLETDSVGEFVARLTDFGLARDLTSDISSTRTGMLVGTTEYMSPEQASGEVQRQGTSSDTFSMGVVLYRLLTGRPPFGGSTDFEVIHQIINSEPVAPCRRSSGVPRDLSSICLRCLEKQPARRYESAAELRDDLDRFLRGEPTNARPITSIERFARWVRRAPATAALMLVLFASLTGLVAGLSIHVRQVAEHAEELSNALQGTRKERELARQANVAAQAARHTANQQRDIAETQRQLARRTSYLSDMRLAFDLWDRGQVHQVKEIIERQIPSDDVDLRGVEWFALEADFRAKYRVIGQHQGGATECLVSDDERRAYTAGVDGLVRIWDLESARLLHQFDPNIGEIHALALSADQSSLIVGGKPWLLDLARVVMLDVTTGQRERSLQTHETTIESIATSADGKWLAAGSRYEAVQLTRLPDGETFTIPSHRRNRTVSFSTDSRLLSVATRDSHDLWQLDREPPEKVSQLTLPGSNPYLSCFVPRFAALAAVYDNERFIAIWKPEMPTLLALAMGGSGLNQAAQFKCVAFRGDAQYLAAGNGAGEIRVWIPHTGGLLADEERSEARKIQPVLKWNPHLGEVTSLSLTTDTRLVSSGMDGHVVVNAPFGTGASNAHWEDLQINVSVLDGNMVLLGCRDGTIRQFELGRTENAEDVVVSGPAPIIGLALSPDGNTIVAGTSFGGVRLYRRQGGKLLRQLVAERVEPAELNQMGISFSPDGQLLAFTSDGGKVEVYDIVSGDRRQTAALENSGWTARFLADGRQLACGGKFNHIRFIDLETGDSASSAANANTHSLATSPDGAWLASAHGNGTIQIMQASPAAEPQVLPGHRFFAESVAFSADSRSVISLDYGGELQFTDLETQTVLGRLKLPSHETSASRYKYAQVHCNEEFLVIHGSGTNSVSDLYVWRISDLVDLP